MSLELLRLENRKQIFTADSPVYTKVRNDMPVIYGIASKCENSLVADGCQIEGTVKNSIIFRGVRVAKGTVVKNSILMQDTIVGTACNLDHVITDKNVSIRDRNNLMGCEKVPYYLGKYATV